MRPTFDDWLIAAILLLALCVGARAWLQAHPQYDPWAPLSLSDDP